MPNSSIEKNSADNTLRKVTWTLTTEDANGDWVKLNEFRDRCVSIQGTFGSGTVVLRGSNNDGADSFILNDVLGTDISVTSAAMFQVMESPEKVRPVITGSAGATVTIIMVLGKSK